MALTNAGPIPPIAQAFGSSAHTLTCSHASFAVNGDIGSGTLLKTTRKVVSNHASFTLSGQAATLTKNSGATALYPGPVPSVGMLLAQPTGVLNAFAGSFSFSGKDATLTKGRMLTCSSASFTFSGAPGLSDFQITSSNASFGFTGRSATLTRTYLPLTATRATFTLTGQAAGLAKQSATARVLAANVALFSLSGQSASLNGQNRTLACSHATFSMSGRAISLPSRVWAQVTRETSGWTVVIPSSSTWT